MTSSLAMSLPLTSVALALGLLTIFAVPGYSQRAQESPLAAVSNEFSQRLYGELSSGRRSLVYSPYSIHSALSMTSLGAREETADEMATTLGVTSMNGSPHAAYNDLITSMNSVRSVHLHTANAIFANPNIPLKRTFTNAVTNQYQALSTNFDLSAPGGAEAPINDYISEHTEGVIENVLSPGTLTPNTVLVLVNTIFFNGTWLNQFQEYSTRDADFHLPGGRPTVQVPMMRQTTSFPVKFDRRRGVDVLQLPFQGGRFGLYIALPRTVDGITDLEQSLTDPAQVDALFEGLTDQYIEVFIPKFKITTKVTLNDQLKDLGMTRSFNPRLANFEGMSDAGNIFISDVIHMAEIEVEEHGTVAAAATVVHVTYLSMPPPPSGEFRADHPFVFFLRDNTTGVILFQGKYGGTPSP